MSTALSSSGIWSKGSVLPTPPVQVLEGVMPISLPGALDDMMRLLYVVIVEGAFIKPSRDVRL